MGLFLKIVVNAFLIMALVTLVLWSFFVVFMKIPPKSTVFCFMSYIFTGIINLIIDTIYYNYYNIIEGLNQHDVYYLVKELTL